MYFLTFSNDTNSCINLSRFISSGFISNDILDLSYLHIKDMPYMKQFYAFLKLFVISKRSFTFFLLNTNS